MLPEGWFWLTHVRIRLVEFVRTYIHEMHLRLRLQVKTISRYKKERKEACHAQLQFCKDSMGRMGEGEKRTWENQAPLHRIGRVGMAPHYEVLPFDSVRDTSCRGTSR